jgi:hypothetical protein
MNAILFLVERAAGAVSVAARILVREWRTRRHTLLAAVIVSLAIASAVYGTLRSRPRSDVPRTPGRSVDAPHRGHFLRRDGGT